MINDIQNNTDHVGELMSGYIDGELTQQDRQRVEVHCGACAQCRTTLEELKALRQAVGNARLSELGEDQWREQMADTTVKITRGIGWLMFIGGILVCSGIGLFAFFIESSLSLREKLLVAAIYGGLAVLFVSVLRQRLIERKSDKYKDVEI